MKRTVGYEIKSLNSMLEREIISKHKEKDMWLTPLQIEIIKYLYANKDTNIYQRDLEQHTHLRRSTISGVLNTMERNGIIVRLLTKKDGRLKEIKLTSISFEKITEIKGKIKEFEDLLQDGISKEELDSFFNVIDKIKNNINKENKK